MSYAGKTPQFDTVTATSMSATDVATGSVSIENDTVYIGDKTTDGSFRLFKDGADLKIQVRVAGVWTDKDVIQP